MSTLSYPGVYIREVPSGVRTVRGVATSITAFVGRARRGPLNQATRVQGIAEYTRIFGAPWQASTMGYAVEHFFQHGGGDALVIRVFNGDVAANTATIELPTAGGSLVLEAASPGMWGENLSAEVDHDTADPGDGAQFNLVVQELDAPGGTAVATESFRNVSADPDSNRFVVNVLASDSALVRVRTPPPAGPPPERPNPGPGTVSVAANADGSPITDTEVTGTAADRTGFHALDDADIFNLLVIPPLERDADVAEATWADAAQYCQDNRAMLVVDPPASWTTPPSTAISDAESGVNSLRSTVGNATAINAMAYFPRLRMPDPLDENRPADFAPGGAIAGIIARTDGRRGVWKAPAGLDASFTGVQGLTYTMTDAQNGVLNPLGLNCLRTFPVTGHVVWGARTLAGADRLASEWQYIPVRRLALYIEESLFRGTQWVVFEPNDEPLWAQIRLNVGTFMQSLFRQGAFQGSSPRDAYLVKCDAETTTQADINAGIVNILVGFAPLKPAEFVVIRIQQLAGQVQA